VHAHGRIPVSPTVTQQDIVSHTLLLIPLFPSGQRVAAFVPMGPFEKGDLVKVNAKAGRNTVHNGEVGMVVEVLQGSYAGWIKVFLDNGSNYTYGTELKASMTLFELQRKAEPGLDPGMYQDIERIERTFNSEEKERERERQREISQDVRRKRRCKGIAKALLNTSWEEGVDVQKLHAWLDPKPDKETIDTVLNDAFMDFSPDFPASSMEPRTTLLGYAVFAKQKDVCDLLLAAGADPDAQIYVYLEMGVGSTAMYDCKIKDTKQWHELFP